MNAPDSRVHSLVLLELRPITHYASSLVVSCFSVFFHANTIVVYIDRVRLKTPDIKT